jgi:hypothetical protein
MYRTPGSGSSTPQGCVLLYGPTGCGKTIFLKSTANEFRLPHEMISCRKLKEQFTEGVKTQLYFKKLFARARQSAPSMVILDDIDEITSKKSLGDQKIRKAVFHLLRELDSIKPGDRLLITATSDRPYLIEPLLFKAKRFDKLIFVPMPNSESREELFKLYLKEFSIDDDVNYKSLGRISRGYNGSDIERVVEYSIQFADDDDSNITMHHLENAVSAVTPMLTTDELEPIKRFFMNYKSGSLLRADEIPSKAEPAIAISAEEAGVELDFEIESEDEGEEDEKSESGESPAIDWSDEEPEESESDEDDEGDKDTGIDDEYKIDFDSDDDDDEDDSQYRRKWVSDDFSSK